MEFSIKLLILRSQQLYYFEYQGYKEKGENIYHLSPITNEILNLVIEDWIIWKRWDIAYHKGIIGKEIHPFLPEDKDRGKQIKSILDDALKITESNYIKLDAEFTIESGQEKVLGMKKYLVNWTKK